MVNGIVGPVEKIGLKATVIDGSQCPDIIPVCIPGSGFMRKGLRKIIKAGRLRIKECDRLAGS